MMTMVLLNNPG